MSAVNSRLTVQMIGLCVIVVGVTTVSATVTDIISKSPLKEVTSVLGNALTYISYKVPLSLGLSGVHLPWLPVLEAILGVCLLYGGYRAFLAPMNRVRLLGDVGYIISEGGVSSSEMVRMVQKRRMVGNVPPIYPNGWFSVIESRELAAGVAKSISCLGKNLAVFRGDDGRAHVIDAYCPHMGANLAAGGLVKGSCLECPFHGWQFRGEDGKCIHIPYCERKHIPDVAKVTAYKTLERNGFVYIWHHAEATEPDWEPAEISEITNREWVYRGRTEHIVNAHIEEIPENGADVAHLPQVHGPILSSGIDLRYTYRKLWSFAKHEWAGTWEQDPQEKHVGVLTLKHSIKLFGTNFRLLDMNVVARQIGPGIVYLTFDSIFGKGAYLQSLTPSEPLTQRMIHHVYFQWLAPAFIAKFFLLAEAIMVERDIMIWNNKRYERKPLFVKSAEDSLVARHRRWYSQFYSEHSPRLSSTAQTNLDW